MKIFQFRILFILLVFKQILIQASIPVFPKPNWINENQFDITTINDALNKNGLVYALSEQKVNLVEKSTFYHNIYKIYNENGLQRGSEISNDIDPTYQNICKLPQK